MPHPNWSEQDLDAAQARLLARSGGVTVKGGKSKTCAAGERSACTPSGLRRNHAEATTRTRQDGPSPISQSFTLYGQLVSGKNQIQLLWRNGKVQK